MRDESRMRLISVTRPCPRSGGLCLLGRLEEGRRIIRPADRVVVERLARFSTFLDVFLDAAGERPSRWGQKNHALAVQ